ncbi:hypothetical protein [Paludisphaera soli]|uniref:hypothetical protein n=1 Tax=Paludisphaera soli TaxID=2712865 RepID=UPI0013ECD1AA|nr:hypothetical protein [Paludisphaera soli]
MTRMEGALRGFVVLPIVVAVLGAVLGCVGGWAPCHGVPYSAGGAVFGLATFGGIFGPPAAVLGGSLGAVFAPGWRQLSVGELMAAIAGLGATLGLFMIWAAFGLSR